MKRFKLLAIPSALILSLASGGSRAADLTPVEESRPEPAPVHAKPDWVFQVTPYLWAAGINGDVSPFRRAPTVHIDKSFSDVMDDLNLAGFINLWARKDQFVFSGDVLYVNLTEAATTGPLPVVGAVAANYDTAQFAATLQAGYRIHEAPDFTFDVLGGARFWRLWNDLNVQAAGRTLAVQNDFGWIDPVIGARAHWHINDTFSVLAQGDLGGFGAGSEFTWQGTATLNYTLNDTLAFSAGYKALAVDYDRDGRVFDTTLHGPVFGATFRF